ncbi:amino acid adenylation domain-containing protein/non-ribosomal peptide synthase protein (TIGR01720 family) [Prauserella isguenensis]|uniref:Amino acid adenylation domain-containing protein/non-ribosomal peptide synthase protein (TIGR01720 family) n=1 Tax=Prauserella isguenensis TaxID=1470180 RepID=A0A839S696_9PSEU|nr:non-ribosomal peptide synthetase [Prauserella isguenensis]MBB3052892.1 amino acid adenylation domain-containing protein/non-ribosomal peptide synthase protein (TIGR01720 family) [Prauserella isguenensis]
MSPSESAAPATEPFELTSAQLGIWNAQRLEPDSPYYVVGDVVELSGDAPVDVALLAEAMTGTVTEAESLRLRMADTASGPRQWVSDEPVAAPRVVDVSGEADPREAAEQLVAEERFALAESSRGMTDGLLYTQTIITLSGTEVWYTQLGHHLVFDGYSAAMLARRTAARYTALVRGEDPPKCPFSPFADFIAADRDYLASDGPEADRAYWVDRMTPMPDLPEWTAPGSGIADTVSAKAVLPAEDVAQLRACADREGVTWGDALLACYAVFLHRVLGRSDVLFALPLMCRTSGAELRTPGMAVNVLPLRVEVRGGDTLGVVARRVAEAMRQLRAHQRYRGENLPRDLAAPGAGAILHGAGVNLKAFDLTLDFAGSTGVMRNVAGGPPEDMGLSVLPARDGGLLLGFEVDARTHSQSDVDARLETVRSIVRQLSADAERTAGQVSPLPAGVRDELLEAWTPAAVPGEPAAVPDVLSALAASRGDELALVHGDERVTYAELAARVHRLARALRARGAGPDDVVAVALPRSADLVVTLLAALDAGAAFLPLDLEHPDERLRLLLADAQPALIVTDPALGRDVGSWPTMTVADAVRHEDRPLSTAELARERRPGDLAYVIYTSGSTGTPKGVLVPSAGLRALLHHQRATVIAETQRRTGRRLRVAHTYSFAFDSALDQLLWLLCGHELHLYDTDVTQDADALLAAYARDAIDVVDTTPSLAAPLVDAGLLTGPHRPSLVVLGGEATPPSLWRRIAESAVDGRNIYGPTEATVDAAYAGIAGETPVIGRPLAGMRTYLLDNALQPVAPGSVGELYLAGPQLARGYLGRFAGTAERFVADPYGAPGERMYRTGDLARWTPERGFDYVGRADGQVKIRGHRVEVGEVEAELGASPGVSGAAAMVRHDTAAPRLVGYVVPERGAAPSPDGLREALAERLPDHLVPSAVVVLDELPLTVSGKVDRAALPVPRATTSGRPPSSEAERLLCVVVAEVFDLAADEVSPDEDFFGLGGDSISAISVSSRLRARGVELRPRDLLARRDLASLATRMSAVDADVPPVAADEPVGTLPAPPIVRGLLDPHPDPDAFAGYAQWTVVTTSAPLPRASLVAGLGVVLDTHDALRLRLTGRRELEVRPGTAASAEDMVSAEPAGVEPADVAERLAGELDPVAGDLLRLALVGDDRLVIVAHHLVMDGVSWRVLVPDLRAACRGDALAPVGTSWRAHALALAEQGTAGERRGELDHWRAAADPELRPLGVAALDPEQDTAATARRDLTVVNRRSSAAALTTLPAAYRTGTDEILLAALTLALRSVRVRTSTASAANPRPPAFGVTVESHGRDAVTPGADLSRTIGWFTSEFPVRVPADALRTDAELRDALAGGEAAGRLLRAVKEARRAVPDGGVGYGVLRHLDDGVDLEPQPPEVLLNYLGRFVAPDGGDWRLPAREAFGVLEPEDKALEQVLALNCFVHEHAAGDGESGGEDAGDGGDGAGGPRLAVEWTAAGRLVDPALLAELQRGWAEALDALAAHAERIGPGGGGLTPSDLPLASLTQADIDALERLGPVSDVLPATALQAGLSFHTMAAGDADADVYVVQAMLTLTGELDERRLADAAGELLRRQPALRVHLATIVSGEVVQVVPAEADLDWQLIDMSTTDSGTDSPGGGDLEARFAARCREELERPFDPEVPPLIRFRLFRFGPAEHRLVLTNHHALLDGWSMPLAGRTLLGLYRELGGGPAVPPSASLQDYHHWLAGRDRNAALDAWRDALSGVDEATRLAPATARREVSRPGRVTLELGEEFSERLSAFARARGITVTTVLQTAWGLLLGRLTRRRDVVFGCPVSGRPAEVDGVESMIGQLGNTIPVRVRYRPDQSAAELLDAVHDESVALADHHHLGLPDIQRAIGVGELFDTMLVMENFPFNGAGLAVDEKVALAGVDITDATHYPLTVIALPGDALSLVLSYQPHAFTDDTVRGYARWLHTLLTELVTDVDRPVAALPMLDAADAAAVLQRGTSRLPAKARDGVLETFASWVARTPDAEALVCRSRSLTYAELDRLANRLAHRLLDAGAGPETPVGMLLGRDVEMIVALLGILKAGAVYLPLDPDYPNDRLAYMIGDARPVAFVADAGALATLGGEVRGDGTVVRVDDPAVLGDPAVPTDRDADPAHARTELTPDSLAYVIYTSGTTGKPKGVAVTHRGIPDLISLQEEVVGVTAHDRYLHFASTSFDVAFWQTMVPLASGGTLVVAPEEVRVPGDELLDYIAEHRLTGINLLPSFLSAVPEDRAVPDDVFFVVGAERLDPELADRWGRGRRALFNAYGPTEVTINSVTWHYEPGETGAVPIGRPDPNVRAYVLDDGLQPVGTGVAGELYLAGPKLARGYLGRPGQTSQAFVADPYGEPGSRMYRTGDVVYWRPDGQLVFLGRADRQVKVRGFRIELAEIETALTRHPDVRGCAVVVRGGRQLVGYVIPAEGAEFDPVRLREDLLVELPDYMVPAAFVRLDRLPLTPGGKLDEHALPAPEHAGDGTGREPSTHAEEVLLGIVRDVLGADDIRLDDHFLEVGGDSIVSLQVVSRARRQGLRLGPRDVLDGGTVAGIAARCNAAEDGADTGPSTGDAPLTPVMRDLLDRAPEPGDFCQWTELCVPAGGDLATWSRAVDALLRTHDVLRAHLADGDGTQGRADTEGGTGAAAVRTPVLRIPEPDAVTAADVLTRVASTGDVRVLVDGWIADVREQFDVRRAPLVRALWVDRGPDELGRFVLVAHHLLVDGVSWRVLVDDLTDAYEGRELPRPTPFLGWARSLASAADARAGEQAHWRAVGRNPQKRLTRARFDPGRDTGATAVHHEFALDAEVSRTLLTALPAAYHATPDTVLLTALTRAIARWADREPDLYLALEGHGRHAPDPDRDVDLSRTVGWFTAVHPARITLPDGDAATQLKAVKERLRAQGDGLGHGILAAAGRVTPVHPDVSWNYLGQFVQAPDVEHAWQAPPGSAPFGSGGDKLPMPHSLMVNAMTTGDGDGQALHVRITWPRAVLTDDDVAGLAEAFRVELVALASDEDALRGAGRTPSDFELVSLTQSDVDELERRYRVADVVPLSPLQELMLRHSRRAGTRDPYTVQAAFSLTGRVDVDALHAAVCDLVTRHPNLGAAFPPGLDVAVLPADAAPDRRYVDVSAAADVDAEVDRVLAADLAERFDLAAGSPVRLTVVRRSAEAVDLVLTTHHVLSDGWSAPRMLGEIFAAYTARIGGDAELPAPVPFTRYLRWLSHRDRTADVAAWSGELASVDRYDRALPDTPAATRNGTAGSGASAAGEGEDAAGLPEPVTFDLEPQLVRTLAATAAACGITAATLVQGAWAAVLTARSGRKDVHFGTMVSGRPPEVDGVEEIIGLLANTVPVRATLTGHLADALRDLQERQQALAPHHAVSLPALERSVGVKRLFDSLLVFENYPVDPDRLAEPTPGVRLTDMRFREWTHHPVTVTVMPEGAGWRGIVACRPGAVAESADRIAAAFERVLRALPDALGETGGSGDEAMVDGAALVRLAERSLRAGTE